MSQTTPKPQHIEKHFDTIIIGAGISGLACASKLHQHNLSNPDLPQRRICILEARDRIGGRIHSVYKNGCRLDAGANWIHGIGTKEKPNPLMEILPHKRYRALSGTVAFRPTKAPESLDVSLSLREKDGWQHVAGNATSAQHSIEESGDLVIPSEHAGTIMGTVWETIESLHETAHTVPAAEANRTSMLSALLESDTFSNKFKELPSEYHAALSGMPQFLEPMEAAPLVAQSAEHPQDSPGFSLAEFAIDDFDGDQVFLQDGYIAIIEEIARPLIEAGIVHTTVEVNQIDWSKDPILLKTSTGTYAADNVVCTLPLGVLKKKSQDSEPAFFKPALPTEKAQAISSLGFGTLDKIFLVYGKPWWTEKPFSSILQKGFSRRRPFSEASTLVSPEPSSEPDSLAGFTHSLPGFSISPSGKEISTGPRLLSIINLNTLCGFPVLSAFISCANAAQIETLSDANAGTLIHTSLNTWFGRETPRPEAVHVTRWAQDPFSMGSYSHMVTGVSKVEHRGEFQVPVGGRLRFAGEHTSRNHFATAHGALLSGYREAEALLREDEGER